MTLKVWDCHPEGRWYLLVGQIIKQAGLFENPVVSASHYPVRVGDVMITSVKIETVENDDVYVDADYVTTTTIEGKCYVDVNVPEMFRLVQKTDTHLAVLVHYDKNPLDEKERVLHKLQLEIGK